MISIAIPERGQNVVGQVFPCQLSLRRRRRLRTLCRTTGRACRSRSNPSSSCSFGEKCLVWGCVRKKYRTQAIPCRLNSQNMIRLQPKMMSWVGRAVMRSLFVSRRDREYLAESSLVPCESPSSG